MCPSRSPSPADQYDSYFSNNSSSYPNNSNDDFWTCSVLDCSLEIDTDGFQFDSEGYCELHNGGTCHEENCQTRIGRDKILERYDEIYCSNHTKTCRHCSAEIEKSEIYCYEHRECSQNYCANPRTNYQDYCANHTLNSQTPKQCKGSGEKNWGGGDSKCEGKVTTVEGYCYLHENPCKECGRRVAIWDKYCVRHHKACANCSARIFPSDNYCSNCKVNNRREIESQQKKAQAEKETEQTRLKELVKSNTSIVGTIQEVERFSPWFNPNCATVIAEHGNYLVYLVVYEPATKAMGKVIVAIKIADKSSLTEAKSKASELRTNLNGENPILAVFADADSYAHINRIITWPYITEQNIPMKTETYTYEVEELVSYRTGDYAGGGQSYERYTAEGEKQVYPTNPSEHFKPLDIVWIKRIHTTRLGIEYYHVGVYLGNWNGDDWICEIDGDNKGAKIIKWKDFVKEAKDRDCPRELIRFHPIVPFKKHDKIARQITWASENNYRRGEYDLLNKNCEHFANSKVYGIDYSKQIENKKDLIKGSFDVGKVVLLGLPGLFIPKPTLNNDKGSTVNLKNEISNNSLGESSNYQLEARVEQSIPSHISTDRCVIM